MAKSKRSFALKPYRPHMKWVEDLLGECLQMPTVPPGYDLARPLRDASVIPMGEFCYQVVDFKPCRYLKSTSYGSCKCAYLGIEAYFADSRPVARHFGSHAKMETAGVLAIYTLPDSIKECGVNMLFPTTVKGLSEAIDDYEQAVWGMRKTDWIQSYPQQSTYEEQKLRTMALDRFAIWECLCSMVEDVPMQLIFRLQLIDAMHRGHTQASETLSDTSYVGEVARYAQPKKQFWYMYRTAFYDLMYHSQDFCWLKDRPTLLI